MFQNFKDMMWDNRLSLYDKPKAEETGEHEPYILEMLELQAHVQSKHIITVEAPQIEGKHDDMSDAIVRMVWLASKNMGKGKVFSVGGSSGLGGFRAKSGSDLYFGRTHNQKKQTPCK